MSTIRALVGGPSNWAVERGHLCWESVSEWTFRHSLTVGPVLSTTLRSVEVTDERF